TPVEQAVVETRALPTAAQTPAATATLTPVAGGATADVTTPGAHTDPASPLAQRVIYFEFDSAVIDARFQPILDVHSAYLKANPGFKVILQGHTDERGSREYNLALGQRRAESVRQAMSLLGVPDGQMEAVSLGEEKPAVEGHDESAWKMNRRTEIHYVGE
ncbi:MAG: peptidoglycan-associated lipoprotein Pal, partial [Thiobacillaceae bacterium]